MDSIANSNAQNLLKELDDRQEHVLQELDELNLRVEKIIQVYLESRNAIVEN